MSWRGGSIRSVSWVSRRLALSRSPHARLIPAQWSPWAFARSSQRIPRAPRGPYGRGLRADTRRDRSSCECAERASGRNVGQMRPNAALNHPNICTIYEIDESAGQPLCAIRRRSTSASPGDAEPDRAIRFPLAGCRRSGFEWPGRCPLASRGQMGETLLVMRRIEFW